MNSKQSSIRPLGQRSIPSTFLFRSTNRSNDSDCKKNVDIKASNDKGPKISLSEYLNRKLGRNSVVPKSVLGKQRQFSESIEREDVSSSTKGENIGKKRGEADKDLFIDIVLQQFKAPIRDKENVNASPSLELGVASTDDKLEPSKRIRDLGDDSESKRRRKAKTLASKEETIPLYNHYANGGGWWDYNMEGVDNEEIGCSDVWEVKGSTNIGGLDWH